MARPNAGGVAGAVFLLLGLCAAIVMIGMVRTTESNQMERERVMVRQLMESDEYEIGAGIYDVTGPAADVNMMGYAKSSQTTAGIHQRLRSRAFVVADSTGKRVAFASVDCGMAAQLTKLKVVELLEKELPGVYTADNVCISGTHTHSGPAGFLQYTLYQITSLGYVKQAADAFANGIAQSIIQAHKNAKKGKIMINSGMLQDANINRSPSSYMMNPAEERSRYMKYGNDTDKEMVLLKMVDEHGSGIGMVNWFAVHGTSMNNTNSLISGDNKGYASYLFERHMNPNTTTGMGSFVAAFAQTNLGDVSPNTRGPHCQDTGLPCDLVHSTCNGKNELCIASGPGKDMMDSTRIIGEKQYNHSLGLWANAKTTLSGPVDFIHAYVSMPDYTVPHPKTNATTKLCTPAMGYAFAAGTTDGPGAFSFVQNTTSSNPFWNMISHVLAKPSKETEECHAPKPILLDTGDVNTPYAWEPHIVPVQILRIGQVFILGVPAELTTMSGRRLRATVRDALEVEGIKDAIVIVAGLSNTYASYVATYEEYQHQRYEGASTIYGPLTLTAYQHKFSELAHAMGRGEKVDPGPSPPNLESKQVGLLPGVVVDVAGIGHDYGDVTVQPKASYTRGSQARAVFRSGCPRNNLRIQDTFLEVQRQSGSDWVTVAVDGDWETQFHWYREHSLSPASFAEIRWDIPMNAQPGTYRLVHHGDHKTFTGSIHAFKGTSNSFTVA